MSVVQGVNADGSLQETTSLYNSTSSNTVSDNSTMDKNSFLQLLVAEMQYQDPLEPQTNTEFVQQFATFSQVEALQNMQLSFQQSQASSLIGSAVTVKTESASGESGYKTGIVDYVQTKDSKVYLGIDGSLYDIDDLDSVLGDEYYAQLLAEDSEE
jgi:flagellar basal-body rod modification protein FlgD